MNQLPVFDVAVIGGGLAGLTAAIFAARAGRSVILFERAPEPGGRASTQNKEGFYFNQGPHALYRGGRGVEVLRELGITYSGGIAGGDGSWALRNGERHPLPRTPAVLETTSLLPESARLEAASLFGSLHQLRTADWDSVSLREWLDTQIQSDELRVLFEALLRLSTYCDDSTTQSAGAALEQMIMGGSGVDYLDGGWQTLVDSLQDAARRAGVRIESHSAVEQVSCDGKTATVRLAAGDLHEARTVISTLGPKAVARLVNGGGVASLRQWSEQAVPVYASCLDVALRRLPRQDNQFAIALDRPLYYSVHTRSAKLAPDDGAVIQLAKYLHAGDTRNDGDTCNELEQLLNSLQPGWRDELVAKRYLPRMLVSNVVVTATSGGTAGRPGGSVPELPNLFLAGDWVGPHGMLADASLASARQAAMLAIQQFAAAQSTVLQSELAVS